MIMPIKATDEMKAAILEECKKKLDSLSAFNGTFKIEVDYKYTDTDKARVSFTPLAWQKQKRLVADFSTEIGWHGVCKRDPNDPAHFIVEDIIVFPQSVTGATVTPSQEEYDMWKGTLPDDHFNNLRFHGHSHVNMDVNPSGTDTTYQKKLSDGIEGLDFTPAEREAVLEAMGDSCFYIFMIMNKSGKFWIRIRDIYCNIEYTTDSIEVVHEEEADPLATFLNDAKGKVRSYYSSQNKGGTNWDCWRKDKGTSGGSKKPADSSVAKSQQKTHGLDAMADESHQEFPIGCFMDGHWTY